MVTPVLRTDTAVKMYLEAIPKGSRVTVYTRNKPKGARTNRVGVFVREAGVWGDFKIKELRFVEIKKFPGEEVVNSSTLAELIESEGMWAGVDAK